MTSNLWKSTDVTNNLRDGLTETKEIIQSGQEMDNFELRKQVLIEECASLQKQCDELTMQKQTIEIESHILLTESRRKIEEKDNELQRLREPYASTTNNQPDANESTKYQEMPNEFLKYQRIINELKDENTHLKSEVLSLKEHNEQIHTLQLRIKELEDWNGDFQENESPKTQNKEYSDLQINIDLLTSRNRQLENDLQRLQSHQRNNQAALEHLDEYEETISQLQEELDQLRSNKKKHQTGNDEDINRLLSEERNRYDAISNLLEETRLQLKNETKQSEEKIMQLEANLKERFERENLQKLKENQIEEEDNRLREMNVREMLERQLIELNEDVQALENDKNQLNNQLDELRQQLQSRDRQIQTFQTSAMTPGAPPTITSSSDTRGLSPTSQTSERLLELETQIRQNEQQFRQLNSIYNQFITLLPSESSLSDNTHVTLSDRFFNLFEQFSTCNGAFFIIQAELESLKQILIEKQDELEKLRTHLELTTDKLTQLQEEQSYSQKNKSFESDEDELEEILGFQQRAPSRQSILSFTPGEKQQLIAQNELLSSLLIEKDQELITSQQAEKTREELIKNFEILRMNLQQMEFDKEVKQIELNDIRNILDEKLRENSSLKKEKIFFIEKITELERERQEQQSIIQTSSRQSSQEREKSPALITTKVLEQNTEQIVTPEQYEKLRSDYDQLLELSKRQHDECLSYYNEYTRIFTLYNDLSTKHSQLRIDSESIQSVIQQKNEAYLQCQNELNTYQNLLYHQKKKSDDIDLLRSTLTEREIKLQALINNETKFLLKQSELEREIKLLEQNNFELKTNEQSIEKMQLELKRITHERDLAVVEKKQCENEMELNRQKLLQSEERELKLNNEIERLRKHLIQIEKSSTTDLIAAEDREKALRNQLIELDDSKRRQTEQIHQLNMNGEQSQQTLITELGMLKHEYAKIEELNTNLNYQLQYQMKCSQNLQNVLEQFQLEREQHVNQYQDSLREQISITARLTNENNEIRTRLEDYNEAIISTHGLNDEIEKKDLLLNTLRNELDHKSKQIVEYNDNFQTINDTRVEKQLVKNILLSYFNTPMDKQQEVIPLFGALVGFTQEEYQKAIDSISNNYNNNAGGSWLTGWLGSNSIKTKTSSETPVYNPDKTFTELLIQYVDQQSGDNHQQSIAKFNTDQYLRNSSDKQSTTVEQDINYLPTSSSILDDLLKT